MNEETASKKKELFALSPERLKQANWHVAEGAGGVSMFVKNFGKDGFWRQGSLGQSNVTGKKCNAKKEAGPPKPALNKEKLAYVHDLFVKYVNAGKPDGPEREGRLKRFNAILAEKIKSVTPKTPKEILPQNDLREEKEYENSV